MGLLQPNTVESSGPYVEAFRQGLAELGYDKGQTITMDVRYAHGSEERLRTLAAELAGADVDVIVTSSTPGVQPARQATTTIPIVFATSGDPVARGSVASLAQPGANGTGLTHEGGQESAKRLDLLTQAVPTISRVAILWNQFVVNLKTARALGLSIPQSVLVQATEVIE